MDLHNIHTTVCAVRITMSEVHAELKAIRMALQQPQTSIRYERKGDYSIALIIVLIVNVVLTIWTLIKIR